MAKKSNRVSITDIAREAGCSRATVSLALRDDPSIPRTTRDRIKAHATRLNYKPNPFISKLLTETIRTRHGNRGVVIAWLSTQPPWKGWREHGPPGFEAACKRAQEYGFQIEYFPLHDLEISPKELNKMLWTRGVAGLLIPALGTDLPIAKGATLPIEWNNYCAVEIDDTMTAPVLNRVRHNHLTGIWKALDALESLGYRRIGLCLSRSVDFATHHRWIAGYLFWRRMRRKEAALQPFLVEKFQPGPLLEWIRKKRIEAILSPGTEVFELLRESGVDVPGEIGFASLDAWGTDADRVSGINQRRDVMNSMAVDLLVTLVNRNATGIPEHPTAWTYSGQWQEGATTRRVRDTPPPPPIEDSFIDASG